MSDTTFSAVAPPVIGRFAPTPSGRMHLGNLFCALLAWASIRQKNGKFLLRIEDLDYKRYCDPVAVERLKDDLDWFGITFDADCPKSSYQSARTDIYEAYLKKLQQTATVYPCYCSRDQLHCATAPHTSDGQTLYNGFCLRYLDEKKLAPKKVPSLRLRVPKESISFVDGVYGFYEQSLENECGDFILRRADGIFSYQLAVVVDDALSNVSEIVRGADLLSSTPRQILLYRLLGFPIPSFYHIPLLCGCDGKRLSKRDNDLDLGTLRQKHSSPKPLIELFAQMLGMPARDLPQNAAEFASVFDWKKIPTVPICLPMRLP